MAIRLIPKRLVGQTIRGIRNRLGQTHEQFAEAVGVPDGAVVESWEEGRTQPEAGTLAKIAAMGLVDVLVFHDDTPSGELPQLTPGEASELRGILSRMEALLAEARDIVDAAAGRTVVELLEATAGRAPAATGLEADGALTLAAEVTVKPRARSAGGSSSSGGSKPGGSGSGRARSSSSGGSPRSSSSKPGSKPSSGSGSSSGSRSSSSDTSSGPKSGGSASGGSKSGGSKSGGSKSGGSKSGGSKSGGGSGSSGGGSGSSS